jgi:hypothetical protein
MPNLTQELTLDLILDLIIGLHFSLSELYDWSSFFNPTFISNLILDLNPDPSDLIPNLDIDSIPDLTPDLIRDSIPDLIPDSAIDFITCFHFQSNVHLGL